ncbi:MAG: radical SAM protein [Bacteroides sp.]|nr:radical SAM protein [Bacteroides sp.]
MKASFYNIYTKNKKNVICYNTKCDSFCILSSQDFDLLKNDIQQLSLQSPKVCNGLEQNKFIIEDEVDEYQELCKEYDASINTSTSYYLTLLPSLDCNLRCWHCFEKHIQGSHLTTDSFQAILEHVKQLFLNNSELNYLNVELFGGEPLLYFKGELYPLLSQIKQYVTDLQKSVSFFFVTNAVCITPDTLPLFNGLNASFQISIDGYKDRHDQIKQIPETHEGTYDSMIQTIYALTEQLDNTYINLHINYDDETMPYMKDLIQDLINVDRHKIGIHLERVWQTSNFINYDNEELKSIINLWMLNGFSVSYMNMSRRSYSCKASMKNQSVISYDGAVYKCSGRDFTAEHQDGVLSSNGNIQWDEQKLNKRLSIVTYDNDMCRKCKFLPLCWGPCCQKQMETTPEDFGKFCQKQNMELNIADYMRYRFNNAYICTSLTK